MNQHLITIARFSVNAILSRVGDGKVFITAYDSEYKVNFNSKRLILFKDNLCCVRCNIEGVYFLLQIPRIELKHKKYRRAHFNLFAQNNMLMTKDHIVPASKGGRDGIFNLQTMCYKCNQNKGNAFTPTVNFVSWGHFQRELQKLNENVNNNTSGNI